MSRIARRTIVPVNQITPLTYRDGVTYIQMLTELSEYVKSILHPSLQHTVDELVSDVEAQMDQHHQQYVDGVQEFQRIHDAFMSDVNAKLVALNDGAMSDVVRDESSLLATTLRTIFVDRPLFDELSGDVRFQIERNRIETQQQLTEHRQSVDSSISAIDDRVTAQHEQLGTVDNRVSSLESLYPEHYGANGNDTGNDGPALQRWADDGNTTLKPGSVYRTRQPIEYDRDHVSLFGNGAIIHAVDFDDFAIRITGDYANIEGVVITGEGGQSRGGVNVAGDYATVKNNHVRDFHSENSSAYGLRFSAYRGGHHVSGNTIRNISSTNEGSIDGYTGISRGLYLNTSEPNLSAVEQSLFTENLIDGVYGLEGDGIQILLNQHAQESGPRDNARVTISNNVVDNCSRRCIKIQGSMVEIHNNVVRDSLRRPKKHRQAAVDIILSASVHVTNNDIHVGGHSGAIFYHGLYNRGNYITITNNTIKADVNTKESLVRVDNVLYSSIDQNTLIGGRRGVVIRDSSVSSVSRNTLQSIASPREQSNPVGIVAERSCDNIYIIGNVDLTWSSGHNSIVNQSSGGITRNNVSVGR